MLNDTSMALVGLVVGALFLVLAFASTVSKVTLSVLNPWLGRQISYRDHPRTFITLVFAYGLIGVAAVVITIVSLASGR